MKVPTLVVIAATLVLALGHTGCGCIGTGPVARPYPEPSAHMLLEQLAEQRHQARSFQAESVMDYWIGDDRVKGKVLLMGEKGAKVRINALNPTGDSVAADLACDGDRFQFIDYNNNCQLTGPCSRDSIARLLRVSMAPDDFLLLVVGTTPVIDHDQASLTWDADKGREVLTLTSTRGLTQTIALKSSGGPGGNAPWDVASSVVRDAGGQVLWSLENKDFSTARGVGGAAFRVPRKTLFKQPQEDADLLVRWQTRTLNPTLDAAKFRMEIPAGLPSC